MNKLYEAWSNSDQVSEQDKLTCANWTKQEIDYAFDEQFQFVFGTSGVRLKRGIGTRYFNKQTYTQLILGFIAYLDSKKPENKLVVFGRDNRLYEKEAMELATTIFSACGYRVLVLEDYKMLSTPIVSYLINAKQACGGIMFTASHNPMEYCGFKVYDSNGAQPLSEETEVLQTMIPDYLTALNASYQANEELINFIDQADLDQYFTSIKQALVNTNHEEKKDLKVVFTGHHGSTINDMPAFLNSLGYDVISVKEQNIEDPTFGNDTCFNPEVKESFFESIKYAAEYDAKVMIGSDPDGDRMGIAIKHNGIWHYLSGNETAILAAYYLLSNKSYKKPKYIISTFISTSYVEKIAKDFNCEVHYVDVGFKNHGNLIAKLKKTNDLVIAFEEAIGALWIDFNNDKDSYQYAALLLEMINFYQTHHQQDLIDVLYETIYVKYGAWLNKTIQFTIDGDDWKEKALTIMANLKDFEFDSISNYQIQEIIYHDKAKYLEWKLANNSTIKFRLSGTEPKFKVYIELVTEVYEVNDVYMKELNFTISNIIDFFKNYTGLN